MAIRSAYFPDWSDGPTLLLWGDSSGMRELRDFMQKLRAGARPLSLDRFCEAADGRKIIISLVPDRRESGASFLDNHVEWRLQADLADEFAEMINTLVSCASGHQYLDSFRNEVTVVVSIGEYPAHFGRMGQGFQ